MTDQPASLMFLPLVLFVLDIAPALSAYLIGASSDGMNRIAILIVGLILLIAADLVLAFAPGLWGIMTGVVLWGPHMGFTQCNLATLVVDSTQPELRFTAFGMLNLVTVVALPAASVIAGIFWDAYGAKWTFLAGAVFALVTIAALILPTGGLNRRTLNSDNGNPTTARTRPESK